MRSQSVWNETAIDPALDGPAPQAGATVPEGTPAPGIAGDPARLQAMIVEAYRDILGIDSVPLTASFFTLGGSSLDAVMLCARIGEHVGMPITGADFMKYPSVAKFSDWILAAWKKFAEAPIGLPDLGGAVPLTRTQMEMLLGRDYMDDVTAGYIASVWTLRGRVDVAALDRALQDVHLRHEPLRAAYARQPQPCADPARGHGTVTLEVVAADPDQAVAALRERLFQPLSVDDGLIWRACLVDTGDDAMLLGIVVDHIATDGWAESILLSDLSTAYSARLRGRVPDFGAPAPTMGEVTLEELSLLAFTDIEAQKAYWLRSHAGMGTLPFPAREAADGPGDGPALLELPLDPRLVDACTVTARRCQTTPFAVYLAAYAEALRRVTGASDFGLLMPVQRRHGPKAVATVANMSTLLWLRMRPAAGLSPAEAVTACWESVEAGLANSDVSIMEIIPYLMSELGPAAPLPQAVFNMLDNPPARIEFPGVDAERLDTGWLNPPGELMAEVTPNAHQPGATLRIRFQTRLLSTAQADELGHAFVTVLGELSG
jgi:mycobactin peptide synthetase MbtE